MASSRILPLMTTLLPFFLRSYFDTEKMTRESDPVPSPSRVPDPVDTCKTRKWGASVIPPGAYISTLHLGPFATYV